ncbi:MAG: DUF1778 domain-containing protein [Nitrospirota bacterium]
MSTKDRDKPGKGARYKRLEARVSAVQTLSEHDRKAFVAALLQPAAPGKALRQAAKRYKDRARL